MFGNEMPPRCEIIRVLFDLASWLRVRSCPHEDLDPDQERTRGAGF